MTEKETLTINQVMTLSNAITALGQPENNGALKLNLNGTLALSWNLQEVNRFANPVRTEAAKRRDALSAGGEMSPENRAKFDQEIEEIMQKKVEVTLARIKPADILDTNGTPALAGLLAPLIGLVIDFSDNGKVTNSNAASAN